MNWTPGGWFNTVMFAGAKTVAFSLDVDPGKFFTIQLSDHGIPENAKILSIRFTPHGERCFMPFLSAGNEVLNIQLGREISFFPVPFGDTGRQDTRVDAMITWVALGEELEGRSSLVEGCQAFARDDHLNAVLQANISVDLTTASYVARTCEMLGIPVSRVERMNHKERLAVLVPMITRLTKIPELPTEVMDALLSLNALRNQSAHQASFREQRDKKYIARLINAAIVWFYYYHMVLRPDNRDALMDSFLPPKRATDPPSDEP